ncbi:MULTISPECIES: IS3 family transposase [unclassified Peribacillus]|uniref:IS3 family transposase n=1 Tax=unclassified Peribacillus TaxID=2675266 RepID=UPI00338E2BBA
MARSTYYYWVNAFEREDKYTEIKSLIKEIFHTHKGRYGYRRITLELRNRGAHINHKIVLRLMNELGLKSLVSHEEIPFVQRETRQDCAQHSST